MIANKCEEFGKPFEADPESRTKALRIQVAMPSPTGRPKNQESVRNCQDCGNYVTQGVTLAAFGWNAGMCRASGELILADRLGKYADGCADRTFTAFRMREFDTVATTAVKAEIVLLPEFQDGFGRITPATLLKSRPIEAEKYETDFPVGAKAASRGIRAWRKIVDPEGFGPDLRLPIFARESFDDIEASKIPMTDDQENPQDYIDHAGLTYKVAAMWMELDETPAIWGPQGVGKTELFRYLAWLCGMPFERISITNSSEVDDLIGKPGYSPERGTFFTYGRIPRAWMKPCILDLDEPNAGPPEVWQCIRPLTDNSKQLVVDQNGGERIERHPYCFFGMAMNPAWDPRNTGIATLADADGARLMHIYLDLPPEEVERAILMNALKRDEWDEGAAKDAIDQVMKIAVDLRKLAADDIVPISWGVRTQLKVVRAMRFFTPIQAYRVGALDSLEQSAQEAVLTAVKSHIIE